MGKCPLLEPFEVALLEPGEGALGGLGKEDNPGGAMGRQAWSMPPAGAMGRRPGWTHASLQPVGPGAWTEADSQLLGSMARLRGSSWSEHLIWLSFRILVFSEYLF